MKVLLAIKFHKDNGNRKLIEEISESLRQIGMETVVVARDFEKWGEEKITARELMGFTLENMEKSDLLLIEFSEKGVGLGIEAGYAFAKGIPIVVIAKQGSDISKSMQGLTKEIVFYNVVGELPEKLKKYIPLESRTKGIKRIGVNIDRIRHENIIYNRK